MSRAKDTDPCWKEGQEFFQCLDKNNYDNKLCALYITNNRNCREFWSKVRHDRKQKGIKPYLPDATEREQIKAKYLNDRKSASS